MPGRPTPPDRRIQRRGLRDHVYERILELLLSGELEPGARLAIDTIARELAVSPTPVREALVHLERTGLVTREALKGYRVAPPLSEGELAEVFEARLMLETTAARLATPAGGAMLTQLREAQQRHVRAGERVAEALAAGRVDLALTTEYFASDSDFHAVVLEHCDNRYLISMSESLGAQLHRMRQSALRGVTDVHEAVAEHAAVVDAFSARTTARGEVLSPEQAMRRHIENVRERSLRIARETRTLSQA